MKHTILISIIIFCMASCISKPYKLDPVKIVTKKTSKPDSLVVLNINIPNEKIIKEIDDYIKEVSYITLETNKQSLIGEISKIIFYKDKYYILDKISSSVFIFNINGKFEFKINHVGKGPGEYGNIYDFNLNKIQNRIVILTGHPQKIIQYTLDGNYIEDINVPCFSTSFSVLPNKKYALYLEYAKNKSRVMNEHNLIIIDSIGKIEIGFNPYNSNNVSKKFYKSTMHFFNHDSINYYYEDLRDTIYSITQNSITPKYCLNFLDKAFDPKILAKETLEQDKYFNKPRYCFIYSIHETNDIIHLYCSYEYFIYDVYYSKTNNKYLIGNLLKSDKYLLGDIIAGDNDFFIATLNQIQMLRFQKAISETSSGFDATLIEIAKKFKETDNPVLVKYKIKF